MKKKKMLGGVLRGLALLAMPLALNGAAMAKEPKIGELAPDAELTLVDGSKVTLSALHGQVVVLNFWATWCVPCRKELPLLDTYYRLQKKAGLQVFAVTTEDSLPLYRMKPLFEKLTIQSARKIKGPYAPIGDAVPTSFIIDRAGRVRYAKAGGLTLDVLNQELVPLLNERAPRS
jgi:cytochrome c biogenesis protein CcmG, thiol:disulfide interchange protein DsbE